MSSLLLCRNTRALLGSIAILLSAVAASAQTIDPQRVEFDPSADHASVNADGTPVVQKYTLTIFRSGVTKPYETLDMGKPSPDADGKIRVTFVPLLSVPLQPDVVYLARVDAVGPTGASTSTDSNTFTISSSSTCAPSISPSSASVPSAGGTVNVAVSVASSCAWTAVANDAWITVVSGPSGTGPGTSTLSVAKNPAGSSRSGSVTLATHVLVISQDPGSVVTFTDDPLASGTARVKTVQLTELRAAIDTLRGRYGLAPAVWTDATLTPGVTAVKAVHLTELRVRLNEVYSAISRTAPVYAHTTITAGAAMITAVDVTELRAAVRAIW